MGKTRDRDAERHEHRELRTITGTNEVGDKIYEQNRSTEQTAKNTKHWVHGPRL